MMESLEDIPREEKLIIIATGKYVGEGFDYPRLDTLFILIDNRLVWYGSINLLSYGSSEESIMRLESRELAAELEAMIN